MSNNSNSTTIEKLKTDNPKMLQTLKSTGNLKSLENVTAPPPPVDNINNLETPPLKDPSLITEKPDTFLQPWEDTVISDWFEEVMSKENCLSGDIVENEQVHSHTGPGFRNAFFTAYYSISELPIFGWSKDRINERTRKPGSKEKFFLPSTIKKFVFCFLKLTIGYPVYALNLVIRLFLIIFGPLIRIFKLILGGLWNGTTWFMDVPKMYIPEYIKTENGKKLYDNKSWTAYPWHAIPTYFGAIFPLHIFSKNWGEDYGKGELTIFIIIVMAISAILITLTGINIAVILGVFVYFLFKTLMGVREKVVGIDIRQGGDKSN